VERLNDDLLAAIHKYYPQAITAELTTMEQIELPSDKVTERTLVLSIHMLHRTVRHEAPSMVQLIARVGLAPSG
jgi:hypothetical protein